MNAGPNKEKNEWRLAVAVLILTLVTTPVSGVLAELSVSFVLSLSALASIALVIHLYRLAHPAKALDILLVVFIVFGFATLQARMDGVGFWEMLFYYSCVLGSVSAATLFVISRRRAPA